MEQPFLLLELSGGRWRRSPPLRDYVAHRRHNLELMVIMLRPALRIFLQGPVKCWVMRQMDELGLASSKMHAARAELEEVRRTHEERGTYVALTSSFAGTGGIVEAMVG